MSGTQKNALTIGSIILISFLLANCGNPFKYAPPGRGLEKMVIITR